jgi:Arc/MetJ-type ribon-helix-helix transcriptional regulator
VSKHSKLTSSDTKDRITYRQSTGDLEAVETLVEAGVYPNRSEALRAAVRQFVRDHDIEAYEAQLESEADDGTVGGDGQ